jgi:hypothetical protein
MPFMCNTNLLESVNKNFDINCVMKGFPPDRLFGEELRLSDLLVDRRRKYKPLMFAEEKWDD